MTIKSVDVASTYIAYVQDANNGKRRLVLVLKSLNNGQILRVLVITSKYNKSHKIQKRCYPIHYRKRSGLSKLSYVDITKHCTLITSTFKTKLIGHLSFKDLVGLMRFVENYYKSK